MAAQKVQTALKNINRILSVSETYTLTRTVAAAAAGERLATQYLRRWML